MRSRVCTRMQQFTLIDGAGHWLQGKQPEAVYSAMLYRRTGDIFA